VVGCGPEKCDAERWEKNMAMVDRVRLSHQGRAGHVRTERMDQFQPSEFPAATGAEMNCVRPELPMPLWPLPWLFRPPAGTAP
jgi:hypothetical protein